MDQGSVYDRCRVLQRVRDAMTGSMQLLVRANAIR